VIPTEPPQCLCHARHTHSYESKLVKLTCGELVRKILL